MKNVHYTLFLLPAAVRASADEWKLVWSDEFDKPGLPDSTKWGYEKGLIRNNERQYYTVARKENARVENGMLMIEARKEPWHDRGAAAPSAGKAVRRGRPERADGRLHLGQPDDARQGRLDVWTHRGPRQAPLRPGNLAGHLDARHQHRQGRLAHLRRDRHHGVRRLRPRRHSCQCPHQDV